MKCRKLTIDGPVHTRAAPMAWVLVALLTVGGCSLTPGQRDERVYRRTHFEDRFVDFRRQCRARGGRVFIDAKQGLRRGDIPHRGDRYFCT